MKDISTDLRDEYTALADFCASLSNQDWARPTGFFQWTPWDEIAHLCYFDEAALLAVQNPAAFQIHLAELGPILARGEPISVIARQVYGHLDGAALLAHWRALYARLVAALAATDPKARLPWYGPTMSAKSFASARLMETWAHGQDVYDGLRCTRAPTVRLRHIAQIGFNTFGWTFTNRQLEVPTPAPYLVLAAPDGSEWRWGDALSPQSVQGAAADFCLVVTQRRHVDDTALQVKGEGAQRWMLLAQCFAGPPADGPAPGVRHWVAQAT